MCVYVDKACIIYVFSYFVQLRGNMRVWSYKNTVTSVYCCRCVSSLLRFCVTDIWRTRMKAKKATAGKMKRASHRIVQVWLCLVIEILKNYCKRMRKYIFISLIHSLVIGTGITSQHASLSFTEPRLFLSLYVFK